MTLYYRNVRFECKRPCCAAELTSKSLSSLFPTTTNNTITINAAAAATGARRSSDIRHCRPVMCNQPVGPVRSRSKPGLILRPIHRHVNNFSVGEAKIDEKPSRTPNSKYNFMQLVFFDKGRLYDVQWVLAKPPEAGEFSRIFALKVTLRSVNYRKSGEQDVLLAPPIILLG